MSPRRSSSSASPSGEPPAERPARRALPVERAVSAGGVLFRTGSDGRPEVVLVGRSVDGRWQLPKGLVGRGESLEAAAAREVEEETGIRPRVLAPLGQLSYWFTWEGRRIHKTVHFYLMEFAGGDTARHDAEYDLVQWFDLAEAERRLTFESEREMLRRAVALWEERRKSTESPA